MSDTEEGGAGFGTPEWERNNILLPSAAIIAVKAMMQWGILPANMPEKEATDAINQIVESRLAFGCAECNGFLIAMRLFHHHDWVLKESYHLDAKAVDILSRLDAIADEVKAGHDRHFTEVAAAWVKGTGHGTAEPVGLVRAGC